MTTLLIAIPLFLISPEPLDEAWPPPPGFPALHAAHVVVAACLLALTTGLAVTLRREGRPGSERRP